MLKEIKYLIFILIICFFLFFVGKFYFSETNKKNSYRSFQNIDEKLKLYSKELPVLEDDTKNVIEYVEQSNKKKKKNLISGSYWIPMNNRRAFITGIKSIKLSKKEIKFLKKYKPWGVILFTRNISNIKQTLNLTSSIRKIFNDKYYPILIDQEGGRVNRLKKIISFDNLTSDFFGKIYINDYKKFKIFYNLFVDKTSHLLRLMGININTVPVLDLRVKGSSNIIGDRSFSRNSKIVSQIGDHCIQYFHDNGIGTVIKHIPGHGLAKVDSHNLTPKVNKKFNYLIKNDFNAFKKKKTFLQ